MYRSDKIKGGKLLNGWLNNETTSEIIRIKCKIHSAARHLRFCQDYYQFS